MVYEVRNTAKEIHTVTISNKKINLMLPLKSPVVTLKGKSKIYNIYKDKCLSVCLCVCLCECLSVCLSCLSCLNVCLFVPYSDKRF